MKPILLTFILIISSCTNPVQMYVTASSLILRSEADTESDSLNLIPFGTPLLAIKTSKSAVIDGKSNFWYKIPDLNGYVFGEFLSLSPVMGEKTLTVYRFNTPLPCDGTDAYAEYNEKIILSDGKYRKQIISDWIGESSLSESTGSYKVTAHGIDLIQENSYFRILRSEYPDNKELIGKTQIKNQTLTEQLSWSNSINKFVYRKDFSLLIENPDYFNLNTLCQYIYKPVFNRTDSVPYLCEDYKKSKEIKIPVSISYFCLKTPPKADFNYNIQN